MFHLTCSDIYRRRQAFGTQRRLSDVYTSFMTKSYHLDLKSATIQAGAFAFFFFIIYASYALAFSFGTTLVLQGHGALRGDFFALLVK